jgi:hypothetical protein
MREGERDAYVRIHVCVCVCVCQGVFRSILHELCVYVRKHLTYAYTRGVRVRTRTYKDTDRHTDTHTH